jgi:hypothetical protein
MAILKHNKNTKELRQSKRRFRVGGIKAVIHVLGLSVK